jgi:hypothetical protein
LLLRVYHECATRRDTDRAEVLVWRRDGVRVVAIAVLGPGDNHEPALTVMLPEDE